MSNRGPSSWQAIRFADHARVLVASGRATLLSRSVFSIGGPAIWNRPLNRSYFLVDPPKRRRRSSRAFPPAAARGAKGADPSRGVCTAQFASGEQAPQPEVPTGGLTGFRPTKLRLHLADRRLLEMENRRREGRLAVAAFRAIVEGGRKIRGAAPCRRWRSPGS